MVIGSLATIPPFLAGEYVLPHTCMYTQFTYSTCISVYVYLNLCDAVGSRSKEVFQHEGALPGRPSPTASQVL